MAIQNTTITKAGVISDFITRVMSIARINPSGSLHSGNIPTATIRAWENGTIYTQPGWKQMAQSFPLSSNVYTTPTVADLPGSPIVASTIVSVCKSYAQATTRLRPAVWGLYYTLYVNNQANTVRTGPPFPGPPDNPALAFGGVVTGTLGLTYGQAHLNNFYLAGSSISSSIALTSYLVADEPTRNNTIFASTINNFYSNIASAVDTLRGTMGTVDLRVCHSSCHNNCHSSRGRR